MYSTQGNPRGSATVIRTRRTPLRGKRSIFTTTLDPLDRLWAKVIRLRDPICQFQFVCRGDRTKDAAHLIGRRKRSVRYELECGVGSCWACHRWADRHETERSEWARKNLGAERWNRLLVRAQLTAKQAGVDREGVRVVLKARLAEYE